MKWIAIAALLVVLGGCRQAESEDTGLEERLERWTACVNRQNVRIQQVADLAVLAHIEGEEGSLPGAGFPDEPISCRF